MQENHMHGFQSSRLLPQILLSYGASAVEFFWQYIYMQVFWGAEWDFDRHTKTLHKHNMVLLFHQKLVRTSISQPGPPETPKHKWHISTNPIQVIKNTLMNRNTVWEVDSAPPAQLPARDQPLIPFFCSTGYIVSITKLGVFLKGDGSLWSNSHLYHQTKSSSVGGAYHA